MNIHLNRKQKLILILSILFLFVLAAFFRNGQAGSAFNEGAIAIGSAGEHFASQMNRVLSEHTTDRNPEVSARNVLQAAEFLHHALAVHSKQVGIEAEEARFYKDKLYQLQGYLRQNKPLTTYLSDPKRDQFWQRFVQNVESMTAILSGIREGASGSTRYTFIWALERRRFGRWIRRQMMILADDA